MAGHGEDLSGRDLSGAALSGSDLAGVDLSDADLTNADLQGAILRDAVLRGADLTGADLSGADLTDADLVDATLTDATLSGANLADAVVEPGDGTNAGGAGAGWPLSSVVNSVVTTLTVALGVTLLVADVSWGWVVFVVGFAAVLPAAQQLAARYDSQSGNPASAPSSETEASDDRTSALTTLRDRYARGEIGEDEFEYRVERLLETESVADAADAYAGDDPGDGDREREPDPE